MEDIKRDIVEIIINTKLTSEIDVRQIFTANMRRTATWNCPNVNYAYYDMDAQKTVAFLFSDDLDGDEVLLETTIKTVNEYDACIVCFSVTELMTEKQFSEMLQSRGLDNLPIATVAYDKKCNVMVLRTLLLPNNVAKKRTGHELKSYWCWWRDTSQYEVVTLLELSKKYDSEEGDIYTRKVYPEFFELMISKKTKQWDGRPRNKNYSESLYKAEKQNYKIPMCQLGFWDAETGHITEKGHMLLEVAETYGDHSKRYLNYLSKIILLDGKHLDLIKDLEDFQKQCPEIIPKASADFFILFDDYMANKNSIGTRKPSAVKTGAKKAYVRDEPKLWNKLGIIEMAGAGRYYRPFKGIEFNWQRINEILLSTVDGDNDEEQL